MQLLARQEDDIPRSHVHLAVLGPHAPLPRAHDDGSAVEMALRGGLVARNVADELRDDLRADALVDQHLEVARAHGGALLGIDRYHALTIAGIEVLRHRIRPGQLPERTGERKDPQHLTLSGSELHGLARADVYPIGRPHLEAAPRDVDRALAGHDEEDHVALAEGEHRRGATLGLKQDLRLVERAERFGHEVAVAQGAAAE